jgi:hypothetical protein
LVDDPPALQQNLAVDQSVQGGSRAAHSAAASTAFSTLAAQNLYSGILP